MTPAEPLPFPEPEDQGHRRRRRYLFTILGAVAALVGLSALLYFSPLLPVRQLEITGNDLISDDRATQLLEDLHGQPMPQVGAAEARERLADESAVDDVAVRLELPNTVHIEVLEHQPVAEVHQDQDVLLYNADGEVIATFGDSEWDSDDDDYATPLIDPEAALDDEELFDTVVAVLGQLPAQARSQMETAEAESIDSVQLQLADGRTIVWGSDDRGAQKSAVLDSILDSDEEAFTEVDVIDISTPSSPVTREE